MPAAGCRMCEIGDKVPFLTDGSPPVGGPTVGLPCLFSVSLRTFLNFNKFVTSFELYWCVVCEPHVSAEEMIMITVQWSTFIQFLSDAPRGRSDGRAYVKCKSHVSAEERQCDLWLVYCDAIKGVNPFAAPCGGWKKLHCHDRVSRWRIYICMHEQLKVLFESNVSYRFYDVQ
jgi:hypothetical protein